MRNIARPVIKKSRTSATPTAMPIILELLDFWITTGVPEVELEVLFMEAMGMSVCCEYELNVHCEMEKF